jgi:hypothetical protein
LAPQEGIDSLELVSLVILVFKEPDPSGGRKKRLVL